MDAIAFVFVYIACPYYLNEIYEFVLQCRTDSRSNFVKLKVPFSETSIGSSLWKNLPGSMKKKHLHIA